MLDHACGAGMDLLLAAGKVGSRGRAIGIDMTPAMIECATRAARQAGLSRIAEFREGYYESLPVPDASVDVVISNGVLNLSPDKHRVMAEVFRVLKPGGHLYLADVVVQQELSMEAGSLRGGRAGGARTRGAGQGDRLCGRAYNAAFQLLLRDDSRIQGGEAPVCPVSELHCPEASLIRTPATGPRALRGPLITAREPLSVFAWR